VSASKIDDRAAKNAQVHQVLQAALEDLDGNAGQEDYLHLHDQALHILVAVERTGFFDRAEEIEAMTMANS
jgi:hypothetical protein